MNRNPKTMHERLAWAERDLRQLEATTDPDERRNRLGRVLFDLVTIEKAAAGRECAPDDRAWLDSLLHRAQEIQLAVEPAPGGAEPVRRSRLPWRKADEVLVFWVSQGFRPRAAAGLSRAGLGSLDDLKRCSAEELLEIPGVGPEEVRRCDKLLGGKLHRKSDYWTSRGLPARTAGFLTRAGIETLEDLARMTRGELLLQRGLAERSLEQCEALLGRPLPSPEDDWRKAGCDSPRLARKLVQAKIAGVEELNRKTDSELTAAGLTGSEIAHCRRFARRRR